MEMKFGSDTPEDKSASGSQNSTGGIAKYTFDRKNYKTYKNKEIISVTASPASANFTRDLTRQHEDSVILLDSSSSDLDTSNCNAEDEKQKKFQHDQSTKFGKLLNDIDIRYPALTTTDKISMWKVAQDDLAYDLVHPFNSVMESASDNVPQTPEHVPTVRNDTSKTSDSMIKVRKCYSPKDESCESMVVEIFKRPLEKTPTKTNSYAGSTPSCSQIFSPITIERQSDISQSPSGPDLKIIQDTVEKPLTDQESAASAEINKQAVMYKYLGIETIDDYERDLLKQQEMSSTRRSSRVKYLKMKQSPTSSSDSFVKSVTPEHVADGKLEFQIEASSIESLSPAKSKSSSSVNSISETSQESVIVVSPPTLKRKTLLNVTYFNNKKPSIASDDLAIVEKKTETEDNVPAPNQTTESSSKPTEDRSPSPVSSDRTQLFEFDKHLERIKNIQKQSSEAATAALVAKQNNGKSPPQKQHLIHHLIRSKIRSDLRSGKNRMQHNNKYPRRLRNPSKLMKKKKTRTAYMMSKARTETSKNAQNKKKSDASTSGQSISNFIKINNLYLNVPHDEKASTKGGVQDSKPKILTTGHGSTKMKNVPTATVLPTVPGALLVTHDSCSMENPLSKNDGIVLRLFMTNSLQLIVVQEKVISYWKYVRFSSLIGVTSSMIFTGKIQRNNNDFEIVFPNSCDLCHNDDNPVYLEVRGKQQLAIECYRQCPVASIYTNVYFFDHKKQEMVTTSIQLDSIYGLTPDVRFIILPNSRYFITSWYQLSAENNNRSGLCKYSLTPDLKTLASIKSFPTTNYKILALNILSENRIIGIGDTNITVWNYGNGDVLTSMNLTNRIGRNLACIDYTMMHEKYLFMINILHEDDRYDIKKTIKIIAIDLLATQNASKIINSIQMDIINDDPSNINVTVSKKNDLCIVTFQNGQYILISLNNLQTIHHSFVEPLQKTKSLATATNTKPILSTTDKCEFISSNHSSNISAANTDSGNLLVFNSNSFIVQFSDNILMIKDIMQFILEALK